MTEEHQTQIVAPPWSEEIELPPDADGPQAIRISRGDRAITVEVEFSESGSPTLRVLGASLEIRTSGALKVDCDMFDLQAQRVRIGANGTMTLSAGDRLCVAGDTEVTLQAQSLLSLYCEAGPMLTRALGDMQIRAERIILNEPRTGARCVG